MSVSELFDEFRENDLQVILSGENLQIVDAKGRLNDSLREKIKIHKQEIIDLLSQNDDLDYSDFEYAKLDEKAFADITRKYAAIQTVFPANSLQKGMFFQELSQGDACAYSRQIYFNLGKDIEVKRYFSAWDKVVNDNEMLKACFMGFDTDEIHVIVPEKIQLPVQFEDYSKLDPKTADAQFHNLVESEKSRPFDYSDAPLMRFVAVKLSDGSHKIIWTYHHAILDGWSLPVVVNAVDALYQGEVSDTVSYMEYVKWLASQDESEAEAWWKSVFSQHNFQPLSLKSHESKAGKPGAEKSSQKVILKDQSIGEKMLAWTAQNRTTVNSLLHAAWSLVLKRYFNTRETVVGSVVSTRPASIPNVEKIPGLMINTIPVRLRYDSETDMDAILDQVNLQNLSAMEFGSYPLDKIKKIAGCSGNQELFESLIVFYNYPELSAKSVTDEASEAMIQAAGFSDESNFPVTVLGSRVGESISLSLKYDATVVDEALASDLANAMFCVLVQIMSQDYASKVDQIALENSAKARAVPVIEARGGAPFPIRSGLKGLLQYVANENSNKVAVEYEDEHHSYTQIDQKTNKFARFLKTQLPEKNQRVAVLLDKSVDLIEATLACVKASLPVLLIDPREPTDRLSKKMQAAKIDLLLSHSDFTEDFLDTGFAILELDDSKTVKRINKENGKTIASDPGAEAQDIVFLSVEGNPDADLVCREVRAEEMFEQLCVYNKHFGCEGSVVRALSAAIQSDWFGFSILASACKGDHLVLINEATDLVVNELLEVEALQISAAEVSALLARKYNFEGIKHIDIYGGELAQDDLNKLQKLCADARVFNHALTERKYLLELCRQLIPSDNSEYEGWVRASKDAEYFVLDENLNPLPPRATGWLCRRSPDAALVSSNESATQSDDGSVQFVDTEYSYYYVDGQKVYFSEVEKALLSVSGVTDAVVMVRDDAEYEKGARLVAYLVMENNFVESLNGFTDNEEYYDEVFRIKAALSPIVPKTMVPDTFVFMESLALDESRVALRKSLPSPDKINKERRQHEEPADDIERKILAFWEGGFLLNGLSVTDDYFDLGGSSLLQIKLLNLMNKEFLVELTWEDLFNKKATVRSQADRIKQEMGLL